MPARRARSNGLRGAQFVRQWRLLKILEAARREMAVEELRAALDEPHSKRTLYRDLRVLQHAGFPLDNEKQKWRLLDASFRKSYARSFAETYPFPPPATIYGMLLSLVGERVRARHVGVRLAFAFARRPRVATTLRKLSRYKYGVANKQEKLGNAPDFVETLCDIDFLCWVDSSQEARGSEQLPTLDERVSQAITKPSEVTRSDVLCLGLSDDAVDGVSLCDRCDGTWHWLSPDEAGDIELPVWVDHVGSQNTRWQRFHFASEEQHVSDHPASAQFVQVVDPRPMLV